MNRELWRLRSFENEIPTHYPCPVCYNGTLEHFKTNMEITSEGRKSIRDTNNYPDPGGIEHVFSGFFKCTKKACGNFITVIGRCKTQVSDIVDLPNGACLEDRITVYEPKNFYPNLRLFDLPKEISTGLKEQIDLSFSHYFNDLSSCANRIRTAIELILDEIKAPKYKKAKSGRRHVFKTLHDRIENLMNKKKVLAKKLSAIKIIGNEGSHNGKVEVEDILDAYEILNAVIDMAFVNNKKKVYDIAKEINLKKKLRSQQ